MVKWRRRAAGDRPANHDWAEHMPYVRSIALRALKVRKIPSNLKLRYNYFQQRTRVAL
jgi:hypothetical protein